MKCTRSYILAAALAMFIAPVAGAATVLHQYNLGEAGSLASGRAQDSIGTAHFSGGSTPLTANAHVGSPVPGSTHYTTANNVAGDGQYLSSTSADNWDSLDSQNNFIIEFYARASATASGNQNLVITHNAGTGAIQFYRNSADNWLLAYGGVSVIASTPLTLNAWTHLAAVVTTSGLTATTSFYVDGAFIDSADRARASIPTGRGILTAISGGTLDYVGDLDALRIVAFNPITENPVSLFNIVPAPAAFPAGLAMFALVTMRQRRRRA